MGVVTILLVKIAFKTYLSSLSLNFYHAQFETNCLHVPQLRQAHQSNMKVRVVSLCKTEITEIKR